MKFSAATVAALASTVLAMPAPEKRQAGCAEPVTLSGNPFVDRKLHPNYHYQGEVTEAINAMSDAELKAKAEKLRDVGTFLWLDNIKNIERIPLGVKDVPCDNILGLVVYNLPARDCAAKASNGELPQGAIERYKTEYIDVIAKHISENPNTAFALVIEPDSLPNLVTNIDKPTCQGAAEGYRAGVAYALEKLNLPNVIMYLDAGHGGWLGWEPNLAPGAKELADAWKAAGSPKQFRGIVTNVSGWNAYKKVPGEWEESGDGQYNKAADEQRYVKLLGAELEKAGAPNNAIVDQGRAGVLGIRNEWGDWCNVNAAGFGTRPTADTGDELVDAIVWVKPGGESDGTSDTAATRYDADCGRASAYKPSPEAGTWNQDYFEMLVKNAVPAF